jgi:hypothetical protein
LSDDSAMWVYFDMPERRFLAYVAERGDDWRSPNLELILGDHSKYPHAGKIVDIQGSFHNETGDITFHADFPNPDGLLRHGQTETSLIIRLLKDAIGSYRSDVGRKRNRRSLPCISRVDGAYAHGRYRVCAACVLAFAIVRTTPSSFTHAIPTPPMAHLPNRACSDA